MKTYKEENGKTRVGDFLRGLKDVGKPILQAAGSLTGQAWLTTIAGKIKTSNELDSEQRVLANELIRIDLDDLKNARSRDVKIQESQNSSILAKNVGYIIDIVLITLLVGIVVSLFKLEIPDGNGDILYMVLGVAIGYVGQVITFHRGSSQGSKDKTQGLIQKIIEKQK